MGRCQRRQKRPSAKGWEGHQAQSALDRVTDWSGRHLAQNCVYRGHEGVSCHGSRSTAHRGEATVHAPHPKNSRPSGSLIVRCSLERTLHERSGSCAVIVKAVLAHERMPASTSGRSSSINLDAQSVTGELAEARPVIRAPRPAAGALDYRIRDHAIARPRPAGQWLCHESIYQLPAGTTIASVPRRRLRSASQRDHAQEVMRPCARAGDPELDPGHPD
jgi:hypothetical protein